MVEISDAVAARGRNCQGRAVTTEGEQLRISCLFFGERWMGRLGWETEWIMCFSFREVDEVRYVECDSPEFVVQDEQSALDLIAACGGHNTYRILIRECCLPAPFFDLKTRLAGMFFQKLANYHIVCAVVIAIDERKGKRFHELITEANRGNQYRFFSDRSSAEAWLAET